MPNGPNTPGSGIIRHIGYSIPAAGVGRDIYEGRDRITTRSTKLQGGVYYPSVLTGRTEAIVVDYEKDRTLATHIDHIERYCHLILSRLKSAGRPPRFEDLLRTMSRKIFLDYPYSHRMLDDRYAKKTYPYGTKIHLGKFMHEQDMICRHMGLLFAITLEHLRDKGNPNANMDVGNNTDVRFVADTQYDPKESDPTGHGYVIVRRIESGQRQYFAIDPTAGRSVDVRKLFENDAHEKPPSSYRYLFSAIRILFQNPDTYDNSFKRWLTRLRKGDAQIQALVADTERAFITSGDIAGIQNIRAYLAKGV